MNKEEFHKLFLENCSWRKVQIMDMTQKQKESLCILDEIFKHYKMNNTLIKPDGFIEVTIEDSIRPQIIINRSGIMKYTGYTTERVKNLLKNTFVLPALPIGFDIALQEVTEREIHNMVAEKIKNMSNREIFVLCVKAGIYTSDGKLTKEYGGEE